MWITQSQWIQMKYNATEKWTFPSLTLKTTLLTSFTNAGSNLFITSSRTVYERNWVYKQFRYNIELKKNYLSSGDETLAIISNEHVLSLSQQIIGSIVPGKVRIYFINSYLTNALHFPHRTRQTHESVYERNWLKSLKFIANFEYFQLISFDTIF